MSEQFAAVVLAAGQGTRMRSKLPKVLHQLAGRTMVGHVLGVLSTLGAERTVLVVGHGAKAVQAAVPGDIICVVQSPQLGTGHAVLQARAQLQCWPGPVLVLYGDTPLLRSSTVSSLLSQHCECGATITMLTGLLDDSTGYGRIVRDGDGGVRAIVEERVATLEQRAIQEVNSGLYCFDGSWLWPHLDRLPLTEKGEYYLTDLVALAVIEGRVVVGHRASDPGEALGINNRIDLAAADAVLRGRIRRDLMLAGVTLLDPASVYVDAGVRVGQDTTIYPNCILEGTTVVAEDCVIGPNAHLVNAQVGRGSRVIASVVEDSSLAEEVRVGPFAHLRNGADVGPRVEIGNFAEIKKSRLGADSKMHHFSYLGDAQVGARVNVGAGTITCNFNSETGVKSRTIVEDDAALGSDTMLVAPVRIGRGATTGAGSVVTKDVPDESLAYGVPAKVARKVKKVAPLSDGIHEIGA